MCLHAVVCVAEIGERVTIDMLVYRADFGMGPEQGSGGLAVVMLLLQLPAYNERS